jgi:formylglycine-generating enzyme required for sulfatase activity
MKDARYSVDISEESHHSAAAMGMGLDLLINITGNAVGGVIATLVAHYLISVIQQLLRNHNAVGFIGPGGVLFWASVQEHEATWTQRLIAWAGQSLRSGGSIKLLTGSDTRSAVPAKSADDKRAVVIGANHYHTLRDLKLAESDAVVIANLLRSTGWQVELFLGSDYEIGTEKHRRGINIRDDVQRYLNDFFLSAGQDAFLVLYFAGHGDVYLTSAGDFRGVLEFPLTAIDDPATALETDYLVQNLIVGSRSERILVGLACCYAGAALHTSSDTQQVGRNTLLGVGSMRLLETSALTKTNRSGTSVRKIIEFCEPVDLLFEVEAKDEAGNGKGISIFADAWCRAWSGVGRAGVSLGAGSWGVDFPSFEGGLTDALNRVDTSSSRVSVKISGASSGSVVIWQRPHPTTATHPPTTPSLDAAATHPALMIPQGSEMVGNGDLTKLQYIARRSTAGHRYILSPYQLIRRGAFAMGSSRAELLQWPAIDDDMLAQCRNELHQRHDARWMVPATQTYDFALAVYPVTVAEYQAFLHAVSPDQRRACTPSYWDEQARFLIRPVVWVTLRQAKEYSLWLSEQTRDLGDFYDVASEAEWEKAARWSADSTEVENARAFPFREEQTPAEIDGDWPCNNGNGDSPEPVGSREDCSGYGVWDMTGNVSEWTRSRYVSYNDRYEFRPPGREIAVFAGSGPDIRDDGEFVIRGGSFRDFLSVNVRAARRRIAQAQTAEDDLGFRLVRFAP